VACSTRAGAADEVLQSTCHDLPIHDNHCNWLSRKVHRPRSSTEGRLRATRAVLIGCQVSANEHAPRRLTRRLPLPSRDGHSSACQAPGAALRWALGQRAVGETRLSAGALEAPGGALRGPGAQVLLDFLSVQHAEPAQIIDGPPLESATDHAAILRWTTNTRGSPAVYYGVVQYGTAPQHLTQTAKSPNRWNTNLSYVGYRVRIDGLQPSTTYYYTAYIVRDDGTSIGVQSPVKQFTTPGPGQRVVHHPPQPVPQPR
jgi:Purple acid Phosphatase, N-terminal domain